MGRKDLNTEIKFLISATILSKEGKNARWAEKKLKKSLKNRKKREREKRNDEKKGTRLRF